ncbi:hypothetical protein AS189_03670 [Arthrobacter alpinus]|uniref:Uncharacterized protein n=1 Tax=Arthrobacter alpinus TaxID=656366 RepID=A0A0S2LW80_9MICC|nr:hypothetical protein [Arthrobacter alpinus]ALO65754.1 hypothetical protein AS189_03670 [Arthrobacter alpinus]
MAAAHIAVAHRDPQVVDAERIDRAAGRTAALAPVAVAAPAGPSHYAPAVALDRGLIPSRTRGDLATAAALTYEGSIHLRSPDRQRLV